MGILDEDYRMDDPFKPQKPGEGFDFFPGKILGGLTDSFAATAGGDGGALPVEAYHAPATKPVTDTVGTVKPLTAPVRPTVIEPVKPFMPPAPAPVKATDQPPLEKSMGALNRFGQPVMQESDEMGTVALRIRTESCFTPEILSADLNRTAEVDGQDSQNTGTLAGRVQEEADIIDPLLLIARIRSLKNRQDMGEQLAGFFNNYSDATYRVTSDRIQGMAGWNSVRFDPGVINQYSTTEKRLARDTVSTALNRREDVKWDPELAKRQAYPILDRYAASHGYDAIGNTGFADARFSTRDLKEQTAELGNAILEHMAKGSELNYTHMEQTAQAMKALEKTGYGQAVTDIMASAYTGPLNIGQETANTFMSLMQGYPPPEVMAFGYQMSWLTHGNDTAAWAKEIEDNREYAKYAGQQVYGWFDEGKSRLKALRSDAYKDLRYFTSDPTRSAFLRPDKLTGDFFEKFVPTMVSLALPNKIAAVGNFSKAGTILTQFTWIGARAFNLGASERVNTLLKNPVLVDKNPKFQELLRGTSRSAEEARADFIQAEGRRAGVQAGMLSLLTAGASQLLRMGASSPEGVVFQTLQKFAIHEFSNLAKEAVSVPHEKLIETVQDVGDRRQQ